MIKVLVFNEFLHEKDPACKASEIYPKGIHQCIADFLGTQDDITVDTVTLDDENCGITPEKLKQTDVLIWWGHMAHGRVPDEVAAMVQEAVLDGMGVIFLHSAHKSKPFMKLLGTSCSLTWRESGDLERLWVTAPYHPIAKGIGRYFEIPEDETYAEPFGIPTPEEIVFMTWFTGGELFRSGCTWQRGNGKVFYLQPGHETFPIYYDKNIQTVITNAVRWAAPVYRSEKCMDCPCLPKAHQSGL